MKIHICDDDPGTISFIKKYLEKSYSDVVVTSSQSGMSCLSDISRKTNILFLDNILPDMKGYEVLKKLRKKGVFAKVILITSSKDNDTLLRYFSMDIFHYLKKPLSLKVLKFIMGDISGEVTNPSYVGSLFYSNNNNMSKVYNSIEKLALKKVNILLLGETGTGKEHLVDYLLSINNYKKRSVINCPAIPKSLAESILFGHKKGSFTDAKTDKSGLLEEGHTGLTFFDEIGDLDLGIQTKILRVLQEKKFRSIGSNTDIEYDSRIISATSKNIREMIDLNQFRSDFYYRISDIEIEIPPLRERIEDIPLLVKHFASLFCEQLEISEKVFGFDALKTLCDYSWPGNIRELASFIKRTLILFEEASITSEMIGNQLREPKETKKLEIKNSEKKDLGTLSMKSLNLEEIEKKVISLAIEKHRYNLTAASKELGISRSTLHRKLKKKTG